MTAESSKSMICPVCGGRISVMHSDQVNRCEYCASPVLGPSQSRDCVNHPGTLAEGVCHVCGDLVCKDCVEVRVGDYGGKSFTLINCTKTSCVSESAWANPLNEMYQRLSDMEWADSADNWILRIVGLGAILMMIMELVFVITMMGIQYLTPWGLASPPNIPYLLFLGDTVIILSIIGNIVSAVLLQTALQVYIHERQLGSGILLLVLLVVEAALLLWRGLFWNLRQFPSPWLVPFLLISFGIGTIMIFFGSLAAIFIGYKKHTQLQHARKLIGSTV